MLKGFSRVWVICNKLIASIAFVGVIAAGLNVETLAQENVPVPQERPAQPITPPSDNAQADGAKPKPKPPYQAACPAMMQGRIEAKFLAPIVEGACGEKSPIALQSIFSSSGEDIYKTKLSSAPKVSCQMASAMVEWNGRLNKTAQRVFGSPVAVIFSGNGYQCRRRNNLPDGKISEHGFANAIDIMGFQLANGDKILIKNDWRDGISDMNPKADFLHEIHASACKNFTTVLGPGANQYHKDHFHFDLGCHGKTCTYLLCE